MDAIIIHDLEVWYRVGVPDAERQSPQRLLLCVRLERDFSAPAKTDDLTRTIDYYAVAQRLLGFGEKQSWKLIETLAVDIAETILREFQPQTVTVQVKKFVLPETNYVAVEVTRGTRES